MPKMRISLPLLLFLLLSSSPILQAQNEELRQKLSAFVADHEADYEKKYLNIDDRSIGSIDDSEYAWKDEFMLKSKEKLENNIGNTGYQKFYFSFFAYETLLDRQYALKDWMGNFIEGEAIRPGRPIRKYQYGTPSIVLINDNEIMVCNYRCSDWSEENFKYWKKTLLTYFGQPNTMVIELLCDGPLEWTKNAPDPKERRRLF